MISVAVTSYNETSRHGGRWFQECIKDVSAPDIVSEVVVSDDGSEDWAWLLEIVKSNPKVKLFRSVKNLGVYRNKLRSVSLCENDWVQICDSDDTMDAEHFEALAGLPRDQNTLYCNSFGKPVFDYRTFCGVHDIADYVELAGHPQFPCIFNTGNHFLHKPTFLGVLDGPDPERSQVYIDPTKGGLYKRRVHDGADSSFYNSRWLLSGKKMHVVPGLEYEHRYHTENTSAYSRAPIEKEFLPPLYFYEMARYVNPELPEAGKVTRRHHHSQFWAAFRTDKGPIEVSLTTLEVQGCPAT